MKFCNTCGEVYASQAETCAADGSWLSEWTRTAPQREDSQITSVESVGQPQEDDHTNVEILGARNTTGVARGKNAGGLGQHEVGEHTDVIDRRAPETLTDFDAASRTGTDVGKLVVYDNEVAGPFQGMLISKRYRLESPIGTGAFGVVFDAFDQQENKRVAIKILSPALCDDKRALTRFRREAIAASRIQHPGIVEIHDFGIQDEGVSYIVMEYLAGRDLATLLEEEPFVSPRRAAGIIGQCAQALAAAHDAGVLHRDLKPANIFVVQHEDLSERIKILDFGIAKDRSSNPRNADLTSASKVVGTPYYMSPEQAKGRTLDGRADVYSLGVILYELLTGTRPFEGASVYEILLAHVSAPRVKPSAVRPELAQAAALDAIVLKAIDAASANRFDSMREFADALHGYLSEQDLTLALPGTRGKTPATKQVEARMGMDAETREATLQRAITVSSRPKSRSRLLWWAAVPVALASAVFVLSRSSSKSAEAPAADPKAAAKATEAAPPTPAAAVFDAAPTQVLTNAVGGNALGQATEPEPKTKQPAADPAEDESLEDAEADESQEDAEADESQEDAEADESQEDAEAKRSSRRSRPTRRRKKRTVDTKPKERTRGIEEW